MNIIVCIKHIRKTSNNKNNFGMQGLINPNDLNAIETALSLRDVSEGTVTVLTMGVLEAKESLKKAIAMGVDRVILLNDDAFCGSDTLATSYILAKGIKLIGDFNLIICGKDSYDSSTGQVGPALAEKLGIPHLTCIEEVLGSTDTEVVCRRIIDNTEETIKLQFPALITVTRNINIPRTVTIKGIIKSNKTDIEIWDKRKINADEDLCGFKGSPTKVVKVFEKKASVKAKRIVINFTDSPEQSVKITVEKIKEYLSQKEGVNYGQ